MKRHRGHFKTEANHRQNQSENQQGVQRRGARPLPAKMRGNIVEIRRPGDAINQA